MSQKGSNLNASLTYRPCQHIGSKNWPIWSPSPIHNLPTSFADTNSSLETALLWAHSVLQRETSKLPHFQVSRVANPVSTSDLWDVVNILLRLNQQTCKCTSNTTFRNLTHSPSTCMIQHNPHLELFPSTVRKIIAKPQDHATPRFEHLSNPLCGLLPRRLTKFHYLTIFRCTQC